MRFFIQMFVCVCFNQLLSINALKVLIAKLNQGVCSIVISILGHLAGIFTVLFVTLIASLVFNEATWH